MAKVISGAQYSELATLYGQLRQVLGSANTYMLDALDIIAKYDEVEPTRDLIVSFDNVYQQQSVTLASSSQFLEVVRALNNHILTRARTSDGQAYTSVNQYLQDEETDNPGDVGFPQEWAEMSAQVGQTLDNSFIE